MSHVYAQEYFNSKLEHKDDKAGLIPNPFGRWKGTSQHDLYTHMIMFFGDKIKMFGFASARS